MLILDRRQFTFLLAHDLFRPAFARRSIERADNEFSGLRAGGKPVPTFRDHALRPLHGDAGLMRLNRLGMPGMMHDMIPAARDMLAHMRAVPCRMLHRFARLVHGRGRQNTSDALYQAESSWWETVPTSLTSSVKPDSRICASRCGRRGWRLSLGRRRRTGIAQRLRGNRRAGDQAGREQRGGEFRQHCVLLFVRRRPNLRLRTGADRRGDIYASAAECDLKCRSV